MWKRKVIHLVWKNVRKIRTREKQMELEQWMKKNESDICVINETGLNGNEYGEVSNAYKCAGTNKEWMRWKSGVIGFVIKSEMECQRISCDSEDVCFIEIGSHAKGYAFRENIFEL